MVVQSYGAGALKLEKENDQFFWTREGEHSKQNYPNKEAAVLALKSHGIRWVKDQQVLPSNP